MAAFKNVGRNLKEDLRRNYQLYIIFLPALAYFIIFHYLPMYGVQIAFRNYLPARGIWGSEWWGMYHFERFFRSYNSTTVILNTLKISLLSLVLGFPCPVILALLINELRFKRFQKSLQMISYAPHFVSTVAIVGMGAIGAIMVQLCRLASAANIIVIETVEAKRELAFRLGATQFINPTTEDPEQAIADAGIFNVDRVLECVGFGVTINTALAVAGRCARVVLFGLGDPNKPVAINQYAAITKELDIQTSFLNPHTTGRAIRLLASGALDVDAIISREMGPEELIGELSDRTWSRRGKVLVKWKELE